MYLSKQKLQEPEANIKCPWSCSMLPCCCFCLLIHIWNRHIILRLINILQNNNEFYVHFILKEWLGRSSLAGSSSCRFTLFCDICNAFILQLLNNNKIKMWATLTSSSNNKTNFVNSTSCHEEEEVNVETQVNPLSLVLKLILHMYTMYVVYVRNVLHSSLTSEVTGFISFI